MSALRTWFDGRSLREKRLILVMLGLTALTLVWAGIVRPVRDGLSSARERHADAVVRLATTESAVDAIRGAGRRVPLTGSLADALRAQAESAGFVLASLDERGGGRVHATIQAARPAALSRWVAGLEGGGILVDSATWHDNGDGSVAADLVVRRLRLSTGPAALFGAMLAAALLVFLPMRLALGWIGLGDQGISARSVGGSVWDGRLVEARFGDLALGTLHAGLSPFALLVGRARIGLSDDAGSIRGAITISRHRRGLDDVTATLPTGRVFAPLPVTSLILEDVTIRFVDDACDTAEGRVRATLVGDAGGVPLPTQLSGNARCDGTQLLLPLASQAGTEAVDLRITGAGRYTAQMRIAPSDPAAAERLAAAGFTPSGSGYRLSIEGRF